MSKMSNLAIQEQNKKLTYVIDCESRPQLNLVDIFNDGISAPKNLKDPEKIAQSLEDKKKGSIKAMSVDPDYADIFCIGVKAIGEEPRLMNLEEFAVFVDSTLEAGYTMEFVTYNGNKFDIPLIYKQAIKQNIPGFKYKMFKELTARYPKNNYPITHIDLMEVINNFGDWKSLDKLLQIYCGISKKEINFETCTDDELRQRCLDDICNTEKLYLKFLPIIN